MAGTQLSVVGGNHEDMTKCSVCQGVFKEPKLLPCIHTFCAKCLKTTGSIGKTATGKQLGTCPACGVSFEIPTEGCDALSKDYYMERLVVLTMIPKLPSIETHCSSCSEEDRDDDQSTPASMFCPDCLMNLCEQCCRHHSKSRLTSEHRLVSGPRDLRSTDVSLLRRSSCQTHGGEDINVYCCQCRTCTCALCFIEGHGDCHSWSPLKTVAVSFRTQILGRVNDLAVAVAETLDRSQRLQRSKNSAEVRDEELKREVCSRRDRLRILISREADGLVAKIDEEQVVRRKVMEELERRLLNLKSYRRYCKSILKNGTDEEICRMEGALQTRGKELQELSSAVIAMHHNRTQDDADDYSFRNIKDVPNSSGTNIIVYLQDILDKWEKENPQLAAKQAEQEISNSEVIKRLHDQIASLNNKMEAIKSTNSGLKSEIENRNLTLASEVRKTVSLRQGMTKVKVELDGQKKETEKLREKLETMQKDFDNKETAMKTTVTKLCQDINKERTNRTEEAAKNIKFREELERMQEKLKQESESKLKQGKEYQFQVKLLEGKLEVKNKSISEFENKHQEQSIEIRRLKDENSKLGDIVKNIRTDFAISKITATDSQRRVDELLQELEKERSKNKKQMDENKALADSLDRQDAHWRLLLNSKTSESNIQRELIEEMRQTIEMKRADGEELRIELNDVKARLSQQSNEILLKERNAFRSQLPIVFVLLLFVGFFICCLR